jgi:hypothetical protein
MKVIVRTEATVKPTRPLTPIELYTAIKSVAGKTVEVDIDVNKTVQELADATDAKLNIDPAVTIEERLMSGSNVVGNNTPLSDTDIREGSTVIYKFVLLA